MKHKIILMTTLLLSFSDLMAQSPIDNMLGLLKQPMTKPDAIGIYCIGYGLYKEETKKLMLTEDEKKMNQGIIFLLGDLRQVCMAAAANMLPADARKEANDELTKI